MADEPTPPAPPVEPLRVKVTREPFSDFFQIHLEDGQVEEMEIDELNKWFDERGADMYAIGKALDHVWNFHQAEITIRYPKRPKPTISDRYIPKLT